MEAEIKYARMQRSVTLSWLGLLKKNYAMYLLLVPGIIYYTLFKYIPMGGIVIAFKEYRLIEGVWGSPWVGFANFQRFFNGVYFWEILGNTIIISFYKLLFAFPAPIILALLLNEVTVGWFKRLVQTISYLPHFISWVIIYGLLIAFMSPGNGLINQVLKQSAFESISFLTETDWIRSLLVMTDIWHGVGWGAIIYLAAIAGVDPSLYEAAIVDGASKWRQLWHITLPGIRNVIILMLLLRLSNILDVGFDQVFMMSNALNRDNSDIIDTWVYREGLQRMEYGLATAVGMFKSIIGFVLLIGTNKLAKRFDGQIW